MAKIFINSKDTVTVRALDELESHGVGSVLAIFDAASWAEPAFATERNKFKVTAFGTGIHCTAESRVTAVNHFCYVINDNLTWMQDVYHFFVMVIKNVLEYVHKIIMTQKKKKENRQTDLFHLPQDDLIDELKNLDVLSITPMDALNTLFRRREKARRL